MHRPGPQARAGGGGRTASATGANARASRAAVLAHGPVALAHVTRLARIDDRHRPSGGGQRRHHRPLVAPRGCQDHQGGRHGWEPLYQGSHPDVSVGDGPPFAGGPQGAIALSVGDLDPHTPRRGRPQHS